MKVALVHDWLTGMRGGERCLCAFLAMYPDADIVTLFHIPGTTTEEIDRRVTQTSFLNRLPYVQRYYRALLPFYPLAARALDLSAYDLVISLSHAAAKNARVRQGVPHVCYCFTPMRYVWDQAEQYFGSVTPLLQPLLRALRFWDLSGAGRVSHFVAISRFVAARIRCFYGRSATVISPPTDASWVRPLKRFRKGEAFLCAGALVSYKKIELAIQACNRLREPLWIVGQGPESEYLKQLAGPTIHFFGRLSDVELGELYANCRALLFPGVEDFGMIPVECMAAGRPVIGHYTGALRETVRGVRSWQPGARVSPQDTGVFYRVRASASDEQRIEALVGAINFFSKHEEEIAPEACHAQAQLFSPHVFGVAWGEFCNAHQIPAPHLPAAKQELPVDLRFSSESQVVGGYA